MRFYRINFATGYRIGYKKPTIIIDSTYLYRALLKISTMIGLDELADAIIRGKILLSSMLPGAKINGVEAMLIPIPRLPLAERKFKARFATPEAAWKMLRRLTIRIAEWRRIRGIRLRELEVEYVKDYGIIAVPGESLDEVYMPRIEVEYRNTIDRISSAANPYLLAYTKADRMYLVADAGRFQDDLELALRMLGEIGIGGIRSRGLGRFTVEQVEKFQAIGRLGPVPVGFSILLGSLPPLPQIDNTLTLADVVEVTGYSAEIVQEHRLPRMILLGTGSIVNLKGSLNLPVKWSLDGGEQVFIFNPIAIGGA